MGKITVGILTVSDSCSAGTAVDSSGPNLSSIIKLSDFAADMVVETSKCIPDDNRVIEETLKFWADELDIDLIFTTGGTGFGPRDVTPEATRKVIDREAPGLAHLMLSESLKITPFACLYRGICGIRKQTLIINTPGSKKASSEFLLSIIKCIPHAIAVLKNEKTTVQKDHNAIQKLEGHGSCSHAHNQMNLSRVARRPRTHEFLYPLIDYGEALKTVLSVCDSTHEESINLKDKNERQRALGLVLYEDVRAGEPFPSFRASIKDGYAVRAGAGKGVYSVIGDSTAGSSPKSSTNMESGKTCFRISTGAPVPDGMDAVVQVEDTELVEEDNDGREEVSIRILVEPRVGQDIRQIGSDIAKREVIARANQRITDTEMGLFATLNIEKLTVFRQPTIGIMSTGDELVEPWSVNSPKPGCIRDSNKVVLMCLLKSKGFEALDCGSALDSPEDVIDKLTNALSKVDVIITTGSVSMGEKDLIKNILETHFKANIYFGRVNMKPGKPVTFATLMFEQKVKLVFALPGNPSSASVTTHVLVLPALYKMSGHPSFSPQRIKVEVSTDISLDTRPEFMRAELTLSNCDGVTKIIAVPTGNQISSRLASLRGANGLLCLPARSNDLTILKEKSIIDAILIAELRMD